MIVCHIQENFPPLRLGGVERYILCLSEFVAGNSDTKFILLTDRSFAPYRRFNKFPKCQKLNHLIVYRLGPNLASFLTGLLFRLLHKNSASLERKIVSRLNQEAIDLSELAHVDVFHVHGIWSLKFPSIGLHLSQHFHKPLVVSLHGDFTNGDFSMSVKSPESLNILKHAKAVISFSQSVYSFLRDVGLEHKSFLLPNFVDVSEFRQPRSNENGNGTRIVMVNRLDPDKDPLTAIKAFIRVRKEVTDATLQIVGGGALYGHIGALINKLELQDAVTLAGEQSVVKEFLRNSDIFVATKASYLGTLEAWASGLAVVAPKIGIFKEIIIDGENGLLIPPGDHEQLALALVKLVRDRGFREHLVANGLRTVAEHDVGVVAPLMMAIYDYVVK